MSDDKEAVIFGEVYTCHSCAISVTSMAELKDHVRRIHRVDPEHVSAKRRGRVGLDNSDPRCIRTYHCWILETPDGKVRITLRDTKARP